MKISVINKNNIIMNKFKTIVLLAVLGLTFASCTKENVADDTYAVATASSVTLPDVPSATEVEEEGLSLGEMNKVLLQKVEELTLHVIELQKQIDELKKGRE